MIPPVSYQQIQNTLRSFIEITEQYPAELREVTARMAELLDPTDDSDISLSVREYTTVGGCQSPVADFQFPN